MFTVLYVAPDGTISTELPDCDCTDCGRALFEHQMCPECGYCLTCCDCPPTYEPGDDDDCPYYDEDPRGWGWYAARAADRRNEAYWLRYD